jgi:RHS repeat-associated protein
MPQRNFTSNAYDYGFGGSEKDDEFKGAGNSLDFGARIYDPRLGRFLSLDPKMAEFSFMSPYCYAANTPIQAIDFNGEGPVFKNVEEAQRVVDDVNAIFNKKYGGNSAALSVITEVKVRSFLWFTWNETIITLKTNKDFNWNKDRYTRKLYDYVNMEEETGVEIDDAKPGDYGMTDGDKVVISGKATNYVENSSSANWTFGGIFLHEVLYHKSTLGISEYKQKEKEKAGTGKDAANQMRVYYVLKTGEKHAPQPAYGGIGWTNNAIYIPEEEQKKLKTERAKTGGEKPASN